MGTAVEMGSGGLIAQLTVDDTLLTVFPHPMCNAVQVSA